MRVDPNREISSVTGVAPRTVEKAGPDLGQDKLSLDKADELNRMLSQTPTARAEQVAQAKRLVLDASYPPEVLIHKIAALLANNMDLAGAKN